MERICDSCGQHLRPCWVNEKEGKGSAFTCGNIKCPKYNKPIQASQEWVWTEKLRIFHVVKDVIVYAPESYVLKKGSELKAHAPPILVRTNHVIMTDPDEVAEYLVEIKE